MDMKQDRAGADAGSIDQRLEKLLMRKRHFSFELWQALLLIVIAIPLVNLYALLAIKGAERDATPIEQISYETAHGLEVAKHMVTDAINRYNPRLARGQRFKGEAGWSLPPESAPPGMAVVLSRYDGDEKRGVVEIVDLDSGKTVHAWRPDVEAINALSRAPERVLHLKRDYGRRRYVMTHPYALDDGSLVYHGMGSPLVKIDACSRVVWTVDGDFHHSIERDADGDFWTVETFHPPTIPFVDSDFNDDAISEISPDGRLLFRKSAAQILIDNKLHHIVYSHDKYDPDPIHLNDVQPVMADGPYWKSGDLFLSFRNPSMVALYRPSTNEVIWHKQGPWLMQHDVDIISDHEIAVYNNNTAATPKGGKTIGSNNIVIYDFADAKTREPFTAGFKKQHIHTETNGLFRFLPDGSVMVEEHDYGRLLALTPDGEVRWSYVNRAPNDGRVYHLGWSRALTGKRVKDLEAAYANASCPQ